MTNISSPTSAKSTLVDGVDFVFKFRYSGRMMPVPYFRVKLSSDIAKLNNSEYSYVSIAKHGWKGAWKKALLSLTITKNREKVVRFLNRPPKKEDFLD